MHVETVVLLSHLKADDYITIGVDLDGVEKTAAESKATYQEIKDYVLSQTGLKVSSLYIAQVKRELGLEMGENYNLAKNPDATVPTCPTDKAEAITAALKHFKML